MKRRDLIKLFEQNGWWFKRHGLEHDVYTNGKYSEYIPRHRELNEITAKKMIRRWGLK